jgi:hypothetical protein
MELHTTQNWNYFVTGKTGIKYLKSPFLSNKKKYDYINHKHKRITSSSRNRVAKVSGAAMATLQPSKNAYLLLEDNLIADFGSMDNVPKTKQTKLLMPQENDLVLVRQSYPHCLCRQSRAVCRSCINGLSYEEIANRGGGILNSAKSSTKQLKNKSIINLKSAWKKSCV